MCRKLDLSGVRIYKKEDAAEAISLIGQDVYMSNDEKFEYCYKNKLAGVQVMGYGIPPFLGDTGMGIEACKYLILEKDAKFMKKNLRPFKDVNEFITTTGRAIGNVITYKKKDSDAEYTVLFNGYVRINDNVLGIYLGGRSYTLKELQDDYVYLHADEWKPFGVEE